jgi:GTPase Era involved in 16S rRNA processing
MPFDAFRSTHPTTPMPTTAKSPLAAHFPTQHGNPEALVEHVRRFTGAEAPAVLQPDSPTLDPHSPINATRSTPDSENLNDPPYLVAIVGGKDVGKTSLANAIAGAELAPPTNTGEGTRIAHCYVHDASTAWLEQHLQALLPGRFQIRPHAIHTLKRQVLVDLPDIDSIYDDHIDLTRQFLRHTLYPVFVQSIEKYADHRPQQLLARLADGNDPGNFIFCLNKIDQLVAREGPAAAKVIAADYAQRLQRLLNLPSLPTVHLISAKQPDRFDLPALRETLSRDRSSREVRNAIDLAGERRSQSIADWLDEQRLDERAQAASDRLDLARRIADELLTEPILARVNPVLRSDTSIRFSTADHAARARLARWPLVRAIDLCAQPIFSLFRSNRGHGNDRAAVAEAIARLDADPSTLAARADARLQSLLPTPVDASHPISSNTTEKTSPTNPRALLAAPFQEPLDRLLARTLDRRRERVVERLGRGHGAWLMPVRWLLTIGAALWFAIVQPLSSAVLTTLNPSLDLATLREVVGLLSGEHLLQGLIFAMLWIVMIWIMLRYNSHRWANALLDRIDHNLDDADHLDRVVQQWSDLRLEPLSTHADLARHLAVEARAIAQRSSNPRSAANRSPTPAN